MCCGGSPTLDAAAHEASPPAAKTPAFRSIQGLKPVPLALRQATARGCVRPGAGGRGTCYVVYPLIPYDERSLASLAGLAQQPQEVEQGLKEGVASGFGVFEGLEDHRHSTDGKQVAAAVRAAGEADQGSGRPKWRRARKHCQQGCNRPPLLR